MENLSTKVAHGDLTARIDIPHVSELDTLAGNLNVMAGQIDVLIKKNMEVSWQKSMDLKRYFAMIREKLKK